MSSTLDTATPLFENGPTIDDLHADDTVWHIGAELADDYLEQLGDGPTRKQLKRAEQRCEDPSWVRGLRADARARAGLHPIMTNQQYRASPLAAQYSDAAEKVADHEYYSSNYGWPGHGRAPDPIAYTIHSDILEAVARVQRQRNLHDAIDRRLTACVVCGDRTQGLTCATCQPILQHARLLELCQQKHDGHTLLDHAKRYLEANR